MTTLQQALIDFTSTVLTLGITAVVIGGFAIFAFLLWRGAMKP